MTEHDQWKTGNYGSDYFDGTEDLCQRCFETMDEGAAVPEWEVIVDGRCLCQGCYEELYGEEEE